MHLDRNRDARDGGAGKLQESRCRLRYRATSGKGCVGIADDNHIRVLKVEDWIGAHGAKRPVRDSLVDRYDDITNGDEGGEISRALPFCTCEKTTDFLDSLRSFLSP